MKFAEHLSAHITPEWRKQYIQYDAMKDRLYESQEAAPSPEDVDQGTIDRYYAQIEEEFFRICDLELKKINTFFSEKLAEASRKYASLKTELDAPKHIESRSITKQNAFKRRGSLRLRRDKDEKIMMSHTRKMHDLKLAFSEFYLSLVLLQNYQTLNFTGFRKILKKHDKMFETDKGGKWKCIYVDVAPFYTSKQVEQLIQDTENSFTSELEGGDRQKAMKRLRVPPLGYKQNAWTTYRVGLFSGMNLVLITIAILAALFTDHDDQWKPALRMYRGTFLLILCLFLLAINTYGWRSSGVNHVLIFELDPRDNLSHQQLLEVAGFFSVIWTLSLLGFLLSAQLGIPPFTCPLALVSFMIIFLLNPLPVLHHSARRWLLRVLWRILTAPFHYVGFADFWLADQLNSLTTVLVDFQYLVCFYAVQYDWIGNVHSKDDVCTSTIYGIRPIIACLPAWFRFAQCLRRYRDTRLIYPHIVNAGKYSTTFLVVLFSSLNKWHKDVHGDEVVQNNAFFVLWIICAIFSTCYTLTWDIKMDWGLLEMNVENRFLREEIVYGYKIYYYFAMIEDFILRLAWTIVVSVGEGGFLHNEILITVLASLEVFRRFVWNFFRLENEHLNNCGQFRAVRDISVSPLDENDQELLEAMMDEEDGVTHRRNTDKYLSKKRKHGKEQASQKLWAEEEDEDI